jgi:thiamine biosynthesis protein ThiS
MQIVLNGEPRALAAETSVAGLLKELGIDARKVAIERNLEIVPKSTFETTLLGDGDRLEIVHFIGGGK